MDHLISDKPGDAEEADALLRSKDNVPGLLIRTAAEIEELMALYIEFPEPQGFQMVFPRKDFGALNW